MLFMTITFTFPSLDVVFLPAQLWWHSLGSCQHPLVPSPRTGAPALGRCLTPSLLLTPPPNPCPRGRHSPCCITCLCSSLFPAPGSFIYLLLCLYRPREDSTSLQFKHAAAAAGAEGRELLVDCKEAPRQTSALSFLPPLLSCTTSAPLNIRLARKTRHVGAALPGLP